LSVVGQQRRRSLPANELIETKLVLMADFFFFFFSLVFLPTKQQQRLCMADFYESFLQFAVWCKREMEKKRRGGERMSFFIFYLIILWTATVEL
jgi:hypothetical protein